MAGGDVISSLRAATNNTKLSWAKYSGEMHLPGMNFTGPGTRLYLRLNSNKSPKEPSKSVD